MQDDLPRSYSDALSVGASHYFTGRACKHGHISRRCTRTRNCVECARVRSLEADKPTQRAANRKSYELHRTERLLLGQKWRAANPEKAAAIMRRANLRQESGFTPELVEQRWQDQGGLCAVCQASLRRDRSTHADHCHETGLRRGLLCRGCNIGLGNFKDSPERMRAAAEYIEHWRNKQEQN